MIRLYLHKRWGYADDVPLSQAVVQLLEWRKSIVEGGVTNDIEPTYHQVEQRPSGVDVGT